jgi:hypothetical protein
VVFREELDMTTPPDQKLCKRCGKPVTVHAAEFDVFEQMHWLCFHLEFEHEGDPDTPCGDPSCPWWHIEVFRRALTELGHDPKTVLERASKERWRL